MWAKPCPRCDGRKVLLSSKASSGSAPAIEEWLVCGSCDAVWCYNLITGEFIRMEGDPDHRPEYIVQPDRLKNMEEMSEVHVQIAMNWSDDFKDQFPMLYDYTMRLAGHWYREKEKNAN